MCGLDDKKTSELGYQLIQYVPAPVTRATLPSREAEARPRGPGIWLKRPGAFPEVRPGIFAGAGVSGIVVVAVIHVGNTINIVTKVKYLLLITIDKSLRSAVAHLLPRRCTASAPRLCFV